jgi:translocation and assembly module TamA
LATCAGKILARTLNVNPRKPVVGLVLLCCACLLLSAAREANAELQYVVTGVSDEMRSNVLLHVDTLQLGSRARLSRRDLARIELETRSAVRLALRPFGFYEPEVSSRYTRSNDGEPVLEIAINPGRPMIVETVELEIVGAGRESGNLEKWKQEWPLAAGQRLNQVAWEVEKQHGIEIAQADGFLAATYTQHVIELDLQRSRATLRLTMDSGERYVMGQTDFGEHMLRPGIVEYIPRFSSGDAYSARQMELLRLDLWKTGYFTDIEVLEKPVADAEPPRVDLEINLETKHKNYYQGALGFGTDTGARVQANLSRHPMSSRGDRVDVGLGWQEVNDELTVRSVYRLPRPERAGHFWTLDATIKVENQDLEVKRDEDDKNFIKLANGESDERQLRAGYLKVRNLRAGSRQLLIMPFVQYLNSKRSFAPPALDSESSVPLTSPELDDLLRGTDDAFSVGIDLDLVAVRGSGFDTRGHRERAWAFTAKDGFGSVVDFTQVYLSTRRSFVFADRWKLIARAELGYTKADVGEFELDLETGGVSESIKLSVTALPTFYRFKAGGSASVRGYGFEQLSNNNIGSNNLFTASAEFEYLFLQTWSVAAFADIGNAFNDWSEPALKKGAGLGIRWYSIAGPIRLDVAQALDFEGDPWRFHFTIGTPLL